MSDSGIIYNFTKVVDQTIDLRWPQHSSSALHAVASKLNSFCHRFCLLCLTGTLAWLPHGGCLLGVLESQWRVFKHWVWRIRCQWIPQMPEHTLECLWCAWSPLSGFQFKFYLTAIYLTVCWHRLRKHMEIHLQTNFHYPPLWMNTKKNSQHK